MTKRCAELNRESERLALKLKGLRVSSKLDAQSSDLLQVYAAWNCSPCEKRFSSIVCTELYAEVAMVSSAKMLVKIGLPFAGQLFPALGPLVTQLGAEYGRVPARKMGVPPVSPVMTVPFGRVSVCPAPSVNW